MTSDNPDSRAYHAPSRHPGLRGWALAKLRAREGVGQGHIAAIMGLTQPALSVAEREHLGGLPRGFSSRYQDAVTAAKAGDHFKGCGCKGLADG